MNPAFDPATYPGPRPDGPALVHRGRVVPVEVGGHTAAPVVAHLGAPGPAVLEPGTIRWSLAYGANAAPARLMAKGLDERGAVLLPALVTGWVPAFEGRRTRYGAVPLTLVPDDAAQRVPAWVLGVHEDDVPRLIAPRGEWRPARSRRHPPAWTARWSRLRACTSSAGSAPSRSPTASCSPMRWPTCRVRPHVSSSSTGRGGPGRTTTRLLPPPTWTATVRPHRARAWPSPSRDHGREPR